MDFAVSNIVSKLTLAALLGTTMLTSQQANLNGKSLLVATTRVLLPTTRMTPPTVARVDTKGANKEATITNSNLPGATTKVATIKAVITKEEATTREATIRAATVVATIKEVIREVTVVVATPKEAITNRHPNSTTNNRPSSTSSSLSWSNRHPRRASSAVQVDLPSALEQVFLEVRCLEAR